MPRMLIVEDQSGTLESLEFAVKKVSPKHFSDMPYDVARSYNDAQRMIQNVYEFVMLDHRMPIENMGNLENTDFDRFSRSLEDVGYSLIGAIKRINPKTIVIGTSSLSRSELRGQPAPDYVMSKMWGNAETDLDKILSEVSKQK